MSNTNVSVKLLCDALYVTTVELIVKASADPLIVDATYLPADLDSKTVFDWASSQKPYAWVLYLGEDPVGFYGLTPASSTCGIDVPDRSLERDVWLKDSARGQGVVRAATGIVSAQLIAEGWRHITAVIWESNTAALSGVRNAGFKSLGRGWWEKPGYDGGWCEVWILNLQDAQAS